jgi:hypothetical protein
MNMKKSFVFMRLSLAVETRKKQDKKPGKKRQKKSAERVTCSRSSVYRMWLEGVQNRA